VPTPTGIAQQLKETMMGSELKCGFACTRCGQHHDILPLSYSVTVPRAASLVPKDELEQRVVITPDQCVIDGRDFYLRGRIPISIRDHDEPFIWGVWVEVGPKDFIRTFELWKVEGRETQLPYTGWLDTDIPLFGNTINLKVSVQTQRVGRRPHFTLLDMDHPLGIEQHGGITMTRVRQIAELMLHP
jgi:hypothetical protein